jgi:hypothetical protein
MIQNFMPKIYFIISYILYIVNLFFLIYFQPMLGGMSHNVPAVYDVFAGRISKPQVCSPAKMWVQGGVGA